MKTRAPKFVWPLAKWIGYVVIMLLLLCVVSLGKCQGETSFQKAYKYIQHNEGTYANNPLDKGGETYRGISRKYNKKWFGWQYVDKQKNKQQNDTIHKADFWALDYYLDVWVDNRFDEIENHKLAAYLFDYRINSYYGVRSLERILHKKGFIVNIDNQLDSKELLCINLINPDILLKELSATRVNFYKQLVSKNEDQRPFLGHWLQRARLHTLNKAYG